MNNLEVEYELFKSLCRSKCVVRSPFNEQLIKEIRSKGLKIYHDENSFYVDESIAALSENKIRQSLDLEINQSIHSFNIIYKTSSTNKAITQKCLNGQYSILLTEYQSEGQGRREKKWISPLADNIYLSMQFQLTNHQNAHLLPLLTALSICKALKKTGIDGCQIKWPNDIYLDDKKLAGVLVESRYNAENGSSYVVGIGINVNMQVNNEINQSWTSLRNQQNKMFDRNIIISALLSESLETYNKIAQIDLTKFMYEWRLLDYLHGSEINIVDESGTYSAIAHGIANDGALLIKCSNDIALKKVYSADVSIKKR